MIIAQIENEISSARAYHIFGRAWGGAPPKIKKNIFVCTYGTFT